MIKSNFNSILREYAKTLSPKTIERDLIDKIYGSFNELFGASNCILIGSYPRLTAITPVHDLDILYIVGTWDENNHLPSAELQKLLDQIGNDYVNPTSYILKKSLQTHSVTVEFFSGSEPILSIDIVPAYTYGKNEFGQNTYRVPEVIKEKFHAKRRDLYAKLLSEHKEMSWINSDPRGYIKVATDVGQNSDFRKTVKLVKKWKNNLCDEDEKLKLKSFHLEQVIIKIFQQNQDIKMFDAISIFFYDLPTVVNNPNKIADRANADKYIDDYLAKFTEEEKDKIKQARDGFLIKLELLKESDSVKSLFEIFFYKQYNFFLYKLYDYELYFSKIQSLNLIHFLDLKMNVNILTNTI